MLFFEENKFIILNFIKCLNGLFCLLTLRSKNFVKSLNKEYKFKFKIQIIILFLINQTGNFKTLFLILFEGKNNNTNENTNYLQHKNLKV